MSEKGLIVNGVEVPVTAERMPIDIKWAQTPDVVIESTGIFRVTRKQQRRLWRPPEKWCQKSRF